MVFRKFFERRAGAEPEPAATEGDEAVEEVEVEPEAVPEGADSPEWAESIDWRARAEAVLPTGSSTGSKRAVALYGRSDASGPSHFLRAGGCRVVDADEHELIDCTMALGAVALGYAEAQ